MVQSETTVGTRAPVGHRRKQSDATGPQNHEVAATISAPQTTVGRRRKPESIVSEVPTADVVQTSPSVGRRRKPETDATFYAEIETPSVEAVESIAARPARPVGSRRKPDSDSAAQVVLSPVARSQDKPREAAAPAARATAAATPAAATLATQPKDAKSRPTTAPSKVAAEYHLRNRGETSKASPFIKRRLVPAAGFSALVLASVAAFVDVSSLPDTGQYKDVITAAALSSVTGSTTSRDVERAPVVDSASARAEVEGTLFITKATKVRADATGDAAVLADLEKGQTVRVTGVTEGDWTQIIHKDLPRWVDSDTVSEDKPALLAHEGEISTAVCARGSSIEARLQPDTIRVYRAVCERFPEIRQYWGQANRGTHSTGHSLDIMVSGARGHEVADFLQNRQAELGIKYLIYEQKIWNIEQSSAGWRGMADRGGITANHYDHVHVTTYGSAAK